MKDKNRLYDRIESMGETLVDLFHFVALFIIGATVAWAGVAEYISIMKQGYAELKDILLLFIYLELGAMVGIYFKTHRLPVQYLVYIAITALARHLVIDVQKLDSVFSLYLILTITGAILLLSLSVLVFSYTASRFGRPEDEHRKASSEERK